MIRVPTTGTIVIVDDDDTERMILSRVLAMSCLDNPITEFSSAISFLSAIDKGEGSTFSLVMMDINMPGMTGFEALDEVRGTRSLDSPLIALMVATAQAHDDIARARSLGANLCIAKQSGISAFIAEINNNFEPAAHG